MATKNGGRLILVSIFVIAIVLIVGSIYIFGPDRWVEEKAEEVIQEKTGADIDLTPSTPEIGNKLEQQAIQLTPQVEAPVPWDPQHSLFSSSTYEKFPRNSQLFH